MSSTEFIRGTIKTIILKLLAQHKKMYGYEITQLVAVLSKNEIRLTYGALYPVLYKLEEDGLLVTSTEVVDNRVRKYYSLTSKGKSVAKSKVSELRQFTEVLKSILNDGSRPDFNLKMHTC